MWTKDRLLAYPSGRDYLNHIDQKKIKTRFIDQIINKLKYKPGRYWGVGWAKLTPKVSAMN
jgi:hypothetical protein